jgi:hypothetical protein
MKSNPNTLSFIHRMSSLETSVQETRYSYPDVVADVFILYVEIIMGNNLVDENHPCH